MGRNDQVCSPLSSLLRAERNINAAIPAHPHVPRLLHWVDEVVGDDEWVALVFEAVSGSPPPLPWDRQDAVLVLRSLEELSESLTPAPIPTPTLPDLMASMADSWAKAEKDASPVLAGWDQERLPELNDLAQLAGTRGGLMAGAALLHVDLRADNLVIDRSGSSPHVWFVDWSWACVGPRWVDAALLSLDFAAYGDHRPEGLLAEANVTLRPEALHALLAGLAGNWALALSEPAAPGMGGLREFQRRFFDATVDWLQRCLA